MASGFTQKTADKIYRAIAPSGSGVDEIQRETQLAKNTILTYCREMEKRGFIEIQATRTEGGWLSNLYFQIREPLEPNTIERRVRDAIAILRDKMLSAAKARDLALKLLQGSDHFAQ